MTNTLHRMGAHESLTRDFVMLAMATQGVNEKGAAPKLKEMAEIISSHSPANLGDEGLGGIFTGVPLDVILSSMRDGSYVGAVFVEADRLTETLKELRAADTGMSVVVSAPFQQLFDVAEAAGLKAHTVHMSLGLFGKKEMLPPEWVLEVTTMCGHGMVCQKLVQKLGNRVAGGQDVCAGGGTEACRHLHLRYLQSSPRRRDTGSPGGEFRWRCPLMLIDDQLCTGCEECLDYCCVDAISMADGVATIDLDLCVECSVCKRSGVCPADAFVEQELSWPRSIRSIFSNPLTCFEETGVSGRGTEEMKTNEVTGRFGKDEAGIAIDIGRPNVGTSLADVEKLAIVAARAGLQFESLSPITLMMTDSSAGLLREDVKGERVLSAVIEGKINPDRLVQLVQALREVEDQVDTVFTLGVISRVADDGRTILLKGLLESAGVPVRPNGKVNMGLGRPRAQ